MQYEVTFEVFEQKFYSRLKMQRVFRKLTASTVWTEIYSVIKGSIRASESYLGYVSLHDYLSSQGSSFLTGGEKRNIYFAFLQYEKWKNKISAFDFMDVIDHVWRHKYSGINYSWWGSPARNSYGSLQFDYLLVDEVQDLPPKAIKLLMTLTKQRVFFAGDTAQTIAKGVGARFGDLRQIFTGTSI